ncbi:putative protein N(5)-glutamine methyltransferase [Nocardia callitridis]|uniref:peptide chain release factor N(5)-glutamine methyltransferase n=1 Tax=Nocardia callitridis TaxID=648753 RepID=A0ABP9KAS0_9NOCA
MVVTRESVVVDRLRAAGCVFAEDEARLLIENAAETGAELNELLAQRVSGTPLEYLLGWAEFRGLRVRVAPGVFVPRQRTGYLVEVARTLARRVPSSPIIVLDLCCGTGALGLALATQLAAEQREVELTAADIDPAAVACARDNLAELGARVYEGDLFAALPADFRNRIDILMCNTPYVPSDMIARLPAEARDHEPRAALDGGRDGLDVLRRVAAQAPAWLAPHGHLLVESGQSQADAAVAILDEHALRGSVHASEEYFATVLVGTPR